MYRYSICFTYDGTGDSINPPTHHPDHKFYAPVESGG